MPKAPIHAELSPEEWTLVLALREIPDGPLRAKAIGTIHELAFYLRQPRCLGLQSDGFPCGSPHTSCEECQQSLAFLDDFATRISASVRLP